MRKPPPPPASERREHPRVDLIAQVQVKAGGDILVLQARNVSVGGVFLEGAPKDHPQLQKGVEIDITLFPAHDPEHAPIELRGKVVRIERGDKGGPVGFGLSITTIDKISQGRLRALLRSAG
jgi:hypothetical protein